MDHGYSIPKHPSGMPRPMSRLPLPIYSASSKSIRPSPSRERLQADSGLNLERLRRPSQELFKKPQLPSPAKSRESSYGQNHSLDKWITNSGGSVAEDEDEGDGDHRENRSSRPSLSDRTIETIAQIPSSPSPSKRKSTFFSPESPMASPSRPSSSLNNHHPCPSSLQHGTNGSASQFSSITRTVSTPRTPSSAPNMAQPTFLKRSVSMYRDSHSRSSINGAGATQLPTHNNVSAVPPMSKKESKTPATGPRTSLYGGSKSVSIRPPKGRPSLASNSFPNQVNNESNGSNVKKAAAKTPVTKSRKSSSTLSSNLTSPTSTTSRKSRRTSVTSNCNPSDLAPQELDSKKAAKSSSALRESIAKAKAAKKAAMENNAKNGLGEALGPVDPIDPFGQLSKSEPNKHVLKNRAAAARTSGHLNIAAMGLKEIPEEVLNMYDFDPESEGDWLQRLRSLNLSHNQLDVEAFEIITEISALTDLKLANNKLGGSLTSTIGALSKLEVLDLRENGLTELPDALSDLTTLRILNVAENQLTSIPFDALKALPLVEINAQKNRLQGHLVPASITRFETLQILNVTSNFLESLSLGETLELPNLQQLSIDANRIKALPNISTWKSLLTLTAEDNAICSLPEGFLQLENIKVVEFTGNNITTLDEKLSLLENLISFRIANNPLRERKFLTMDTDELKRVLRGRCEPDQPEAEEEDGSVQTEFTLAPESPTTANAWRIKSGGVLDCSSTDLASLDPADLEPFLASSTAIKCLYLHHNRFHSLPVVSLSLLSHTLTDLDFSHNPFSSTPTTPLLTTPLSLPHLQNLTLSSTGLTTLEHLQRHLSAPNLTFLDVSNNRLMGTLPHIRHSYPSLINFLVSDNQIDSLEFDAVCGLQVLDVSNNSISFLPPRLGLLGSEGTAGAKGSGVSAAGATTCLRRLDVAGNCFRVPRWQVVSKGTEAVLEWLKNRITAEELREWGVVEEEGVD
ncbi:leucine rich repeat domain-containing protein [Histoplasma capsulatum H143]|uniref:Leucine rich repeat domain-containing protein n=1 Tax=Ajellomyces capsulatus (strain H143) TaxID=544712 RepID=C6H522_AJECH|nr:leucine rich repeat domain-containing protein [Histoplasma capsulatum H143]